MTRLPIALFNYENGGRTPCGGYDFGPLQHAFASVDEPPALILFCEAKRYRDDGGEGLYRAAEALSDELGQAYIGVLGASPRGPMPPAIFFNPDLLIQRTWWHDEHDPALFDDKRNVARFAVAPSGQLADARTEFLTFVQHFDHRSGVLRRQQAGLLDRYGDAEQLPVIGGGDLNATASGPHLPQRDWMSAGYRSRSQKGVRIDDGTADGFWVADTDALDHLIGRWDEDKQGRVDGCGLHAVAELAWQANPHTPVLPTVNDHVDAGGGLLIDWLLINTAMLPHVDVASYRVHIPDGFPHPSDHRLVTAAIDL